MVNIDTTEQIRRQLNEMYPGAIPLLITLGGSHSYGTNTDTSDLDYRGVFIKSKDDFYSDNIIDEVNFDNNNTSMFEIRKFIELLGKNNPTALEIINTTTDCILYTHPIFEELIQRKNDYLSKLCMHTFTGYAIKQNKKAKGKDKKNNWEKSRTIRKTPIDFCYVIQNGITIPFAKFIENNNFKQQHFGLTKQPNAKDTYSMYYDKSYIVGFRGIEISNSNEVRLSSIPKEVVEDYFVGHLVFNKDGYSKHCKDYKEYEEYLSKRNNDRWIAVQNSESKIDGKNMAHTQRLIDMGIEIGMGLGVVMKRPNRDYLLSIKRGDIDLESLIVTSEQAILDMREIYSLSDLPLVPSQETLLFLSNSLIKIRKGFYD